MLLKSHSLGRKKKDDAESSTSLYSGVKSNVRDRVSGEVEKGGFNCFARQRGPYWANALKTMWLSQEKVVMSFIVFKEKSMINSWIVLGLICIKVKF